MEASNFQPLQNPAINAPPTFTKSPQRQKSIACSTQSLP
jgi:hypothetical protein